jgi:hypothetical protein
MVTDNTAGEMGSVETPQAEPEKESGPVSVFLSKQSLGGMEVKEGDTITLTVKSTDPETGDIEAVVEPKSEDQPSATMAAFDREMPEEQE